MLSYSFFVNTERATRTPLVRSEEHGLQMLISHGHTYRTSNTICQKHQTKLRGSPNNASSTVAALVAFCVELELDDSIPAPGLPGRVPDRTW